MNKRHILLTFLGCLAMGASAQTTEIKTAKDSLELAFNQQVSKKFNPYSAVVAGHEVFDNAPEIDTKKALYGKLRGLLVQQGNGSSSFNEATLSLYGKAPLILVDGFVRDINNLTTSDIESVTILTDAASTALYGVRGANGVVLVKTKRGKEGKLNIKVGYQFGVNTEFRSPEFADAYTYGKALNQALTNDGLPTRYNALELDAFRTGRYPYEYPNVNWWKEVYQNPGFSHRLNFSFSGGTDRVKYYTAIDYYNDRAMLSHNLSDDRYNSKTTDTRLNIRTNVDVKLTPSTDMRFNMMGKLNENNTPNVNMQSFYDEMYRIPSAAFPIRQKNGIYGGNSIYQDKNPIARLRDSGQHKHSFGSLFADLRLEQDLKSLTPGLKASLGVSLDNRGSMYEKTVKEYLYQEHIAKIDPVTGTLSYTEWEDGNNAAVLDLTKQGFKSLDIAVNLQGKVTYERAFGKHQVNGALIYDQYAYTVKERLGSEKRQSAIINAGYNYDNRYLVNAVATWSGSAYLPEGDKFRFYPAVSAAWIASNEAFMKDFDWLDYLRIHGSFGLSGWDGNLSHELWIPRYQGGAGGFDFTGNGNAGGIFETQLPVLGLTVEKSRKVTLGADFALLNRRLNVGVEGFWEKRSDILIPSVNSVTGIIGVDVAKENAGVEKYRGIGINLSWNDKINDFEYGVDANFTYMNSEMVNENQAYQEYDYLYHKGNKVGQCYGLEAIGFFNDQLEINNSPAQTFGNVRPGDVKYKDQNGDNRIDNKDIVKMCGSKNPEVFFGFSLRAGYKGFALTADFQGMTGLTIDLRNSPLYKPLQNNGTISNTYLEHETPWTPDNKNQATMPRLSTENVQNNYQASSLWYRDGSFLKLRNLKLAYTFPRKMLKLADMQVYVQGTNLFSLDNIDFADPEQLSATYPSTRSFWAGLKFNF